MQVQTYCGACAAEMVETSEFCPVCGPSEFDGSDAALAVFAEMRGWLMDCAWRDIEPEEIAELEAGVVRRAVERHYEGGVRQFRADAGR